MATPVDANDNLCLLRRYVETASAEAFALLAARHRGFVFATQSSDCS
jgi:hypothetical protein